MEARLCSWLASGEKVRACVFARQALPMVWDFGEGNPYMADASRSWASAINW